MSKIDKNLMVQFVKKFHIFDRKVKDLVQKYANIYLNVFDLGDFEDVDSYEIIDERILATVSYISKDDLKDTSFIIPANFLYEDNWEEKAEENIKNQLARKGQMQNF